MGSLRSSICRYDTLLISNTTKVLNPFKFRLLLWFERLRAGPITSIAFNPSSNQDDAHMPDLVVTTRHAHILSLSFPTIKEDHEEDGGVKFVDGFADLNVGLALHLL